MRIDKNIMGSPPFQFHDDCFRGFAYDTEKEELQVMLTKSANNGDLILRFVNTQIFEMQSCVFWGNSDYIYGWHLASEETRIIFASGLFWQENNKLSKSPLSLSADVIESTLSLTSGDALTVVNREVYIAEDKLSSKRAFSMEYNRKSKNILPESISSNCNLFRFDYDYQGRSAFVTFQNSSDKSVFCLQLSNPLFILWKNRRNFTGITTTVRAKQVSDNFFVKLLRAHEEERRAHGYADCSPFLQKGKTFVSVEVNTRDSEGLIVCEAAVCYPLDVQL